MRKERPPGEPAQHRQASSPTDALDEARSDAESARAWLAAIVESSDDAIVSKDLQGIITSWNGAAERIFGYTAGEAVGRPVTMLIPADRQDEEPTILGRLRRGERVDHYETVRQRKDGTLVDVSLTVSPIRDGQGRVVGASKIARDISGRKRAEQELVAATAKFESVFNQSGIFAGIMDVRGYLRDINDLAVNWCGYTKEEVLDRPFWETPWWRGSEEMKARIRAATESAASGIVFREELHYWLADGTERIVDFAMHPIRAPSGVVIFLHPTGIDITERRRAEEALRGQAETLEKLNEIGAKLAAELDLGRVVQAVTDAGTHLSAAQFGAFFHNVTNPAGESYMLYALSGAPREAFDRFGMPRNTALFDPTFSGKGPVRLDDVTKDPRYGQSAPHRGMPKGHLPVRSYLAVPVVSRSGDVIGGLFFGHPKVGVFTDTAERFVTALASQAAVAIDNARLHEQRVQLISELRDADRRKDEFLAMLGHELRNPLAPIRNAAQVLQLVGHDEPRIKLARDIIDRQASHMTRLIDDLLDVSRITRGKIELKRERLRLVEVIETALEASSPLLEAAEHTVAVNGGPEVWIDGDRARLAQVLTNLLTNAAKFTPRGGHIALSVSCTEDTVSISVRDTGVGISKAAQGRIFELFQQENVTVDRTQAGLGIGLTLAKRLVEMHGGSVSVSSDGPGKGSEFTITLPLLEQPAQSEETASSTAIAGPLHILLVEDNLDAAESFKMLLELTGHVVEVARDGVDALRLYEEFSPDVAFIDLGLPGIDGFGVAERIRALGGSRTVLVALSGYGQDQDKRRAHEAGFNAHMTKPVDHDRVEAFLLGVAGATPAAARTRTVH